MISATTATRRPGTKSRRVQADLTGANQTACKSADLLNTTAEEASTVVLWDMTDHNDAREAHRRLASVVRKWMPEASEHDRLDIVQQAVTDGMACPEAREMTFSYLCRLARAARTYHIIGGRRGAINELEHVAGAKVDMRVSLAEQALMRHLTQFEIDQIAADVAAENDRSRTHRAVEPDFMLRRKGALSIDAPTSNTAGTTWSIGDTLEDGVSLRDIERVEGVDPLVNILDRMHDMQDDGSWSAMPVIERRVMAWQAFAARHDAPAPIGASLSHRQRRLAQTLVREAGGVTVLADSFHESEAFEKQYWKGLFAPFGRTTERQRVAICDTFCSLGARAEEVWQACASIATAYYYQATHNRKLHKRVLTWSMFAAPHDAPNPVQSSLSGEQCATALEVIEQTGGILAAAKNFHESDLSTVDSQIDDADERAIDQRRARAMFAPFGRVSRVQRAAITDALVDAGGHASEIWAACIDAANRDRAVQTIAAEPDADE